VILLLEPISRNIDMFVPAYPLPLMEIGSFVKATLPGIRETCGMFAMGLESASYRTLRRMNKVRDRDHYRRYLSNAAARNEIPVMVFMIAGYPGDTEDDLAESPAFAEKLSAKAGAGGHVFKIGECHVYPGTKLYDLARSLPDVVFDDDGVFGQNVVRRPSARLDFETTLDYAARIFRLSNYTPVLQSTLREIMPFFRIPAAAFGDDLLPDSCFMDRGRDVLRVAADSLSRFRATAPRLTARYDEETTHERSRRNLKF